MVSGPGRAEARRARNRLMSPSASDATELGTGPSTAAGLPRRVITIRSPLEARSSKADSRFLASKLPMCSAFI